MNNIKNNNINNNIITANNIHHLRQIIEDEIKKYGNECDLNHIDIGKIDDISVLFRDSEFNGDISRWNTSHITNMYGLFFSSKFDGDISLWDTSNVTDMSNMFCYSLFNQDISTWNVSHVQTMDGIFYLSKFTGDLNDWTPYLANISDAFDKNSIHSPYWAHYPNLEQRKLVIDSYVSKKQLEKNLNKQLSHSLKPQIIRKIKL